MPATPFGYATVQNVPCFLRDNQLVASCPTWANQLQGFEQTTIYRSPHLKYSLIELELGVSSVIETA